MTEQQASENIKKWKASINIEELPEQIFRDIFDYLGFKTIFKSVRNVCKKFREYADSYIDVQGIFMLTGNIDNIAKVIYIFNRKARKIEGFCERAPICPNQHYKSPLIFTGTRILSPFDLLVTREGHCNFEYLMFDLITLKWKLLHKNIPICDKPYNHNCYLTANPNLVHFYTETIKITKRLNFSHPYEYHSMKLYARCLNVETNDNEFQKSHSWCTFEIDVPIELKYLTNYKMLRCSPRGVLFSKGIFVLPREIEGFLTLLWYGELSIDGNYMNWDKIDIRRRSFPVFFRLCFKLKNNLYICYLRENSEGFKTAYYFDGYDLQQKQYKSNEFVMKFPNVRLSSIEPKVLTDVYETFAIMVVSICDTQENFIKEKVIIFTEKDGFEELMNLRTCHRWTCFNSNGDLIRIK